jgi:hypothetical protein
VYWLKLRVSPCKKKKKKKKERLFENLSAEENIWTSEREQEKEKYILSNFITCALQPINKHVIIKDSKMGRAYNKNGKMLNTYKIFEEKPEGKSLITIIRSAFRK